ncbi:unnamed protein product [Effrenium voratum]|nr:unnamed protein product [Effrenium voratum]
MGTGASALPAKVPKDDEDECEDEVAGCGDYEEEDVEFPVDTVKKYARGEEEQAKAQRVIAEWVRQKSTDHEEVEAEAEEILKDALSAFVSLKPEMYSKGIELLMSSIPIPNGETALRAAVRCAGRELMYQILAVIPPESIESLKDPDWLLQTACPCAFDPEECWKFKFFEEEMLPRGKAALIASLSEKDADGRCRILVDQFDNQNLAGMAYVLSLGAESEGVLLKEEAEEVQRVFKLCRAEMDKWPAHVRLCKAIARGDAKEVKEVLAEADVNQDQGDDGQTVSPLALALRRLWEQAWGRCIFRFTLPSSYDVVLSKSNLEVVKVLLAAPGIDVNRGAYAYGWHGAHVRVSALGMAMIDELDTGACYHHPQADRALIAPRKDILQLLLDHPDTDLEHAFLQQGEEGGRETCGALGLLDRDYRAGKDYAAAQMLMQAGALMTPGWKTNLAELDQAVKDVKEDMEKSLQEEKEKTKSSPREDSINEELNYTPYEKRDGVLVVEGITMTQSWMPRDPPISAILQSRLKDLEGVKEWYSVVSKGSNVLTQPRCFPPNFCRAAAALMKMKTNLGKVGVVKVLDFLEFFEFNRAKFPSHPFWEKTVNPFGRPQSKPFYDMLKLEKAFNNELHERLDEASAARADAPEEKIANSCWAADKTEKGYAEVVSSFSRYGSVASKRHGGIHISKSLKIPNCCSTISDNTLRVERQRDSRDSLRSSPRSSIRTSRTPSPYRCRSLPATPRMSVAQRLWEPRRKEFQERLDAAGAAYPENIEAGNDLYPRLPSEPLATSSGAPGYAGGGTGGSSGRHARVAKYQSCRCGNSLMPDAVYCRHCGVKRAECEASDPASSPGNLAAPQAGFGLAPAALAPAPPAPAFSSRPLGHGVSDRDRDRDWLDGRSPKANPRAASFQRLNGFLLRTHMTSLLSALAEDGWLEAWEKERLCCRAREPDSKWAQTFLRIYMRFMETDDVASFVAALKAQIA